MVPANQKKAARVVHSVVSAETDTSQTITCESENEALDWCVWRRPRTGQRQLITIVEDAIAQVDDAQIDNSRILVFDHQLQNGNCSLSIQSITPEDFGTWSCTLFAQTGSVLTGQVEVPRVCVALKYY